jgi:hypothetical protein
MRLADAASYAVTPITSRLVAACSTLRPAV